MLAILDLSLLAWLVIWRRITGGVSPSPLISPSMRPISPDLATPSRRRRSPGLFLKARIVPSFARTASTPSRFPAPPSPPLGSLTDARKFYRPYLHIGGYRCLLCYLPSIAGCKLVAWLMRSWFYRIKPSVTHEPFKPRVPAHSKLLSEFNQSNSSATPTQLRWKPVEIPDSPTDFVDGLFTICGAGSSFLRHGFAIHM